MNILINAAQTEINPEFLNKIKTDISDYRKKFSEDRIGVLISVSDNPSSSLFTEVNTPIVPFFRNFFFNNKIAKIIRDVHPDIVINFSPTSCPVKVPQIFYASLFVKQYANGLSEKTAKKISEKLKSFHFIVVNSIKERDFFSKYFPRYEEKIRLIYRISDGFGKQLEYDDKQLFKARFTQGSEYFLVKPVDDKNLLVNTLKAFSGFKKWQKTNTKLVITEKEDGQNTDIRELLCNYRFREEVVTIPATHTEFDKIFSASYAVILPEKFDADFLYPISALEANTAILFPEESIYSEIINEGVFPFQYQSQDDLTRVMLEVFRDENERSKHIKIACRILNQLQQKNFYDNLKNTLYEIGETERWNTPN